jgi:hypothetical protein
MAQSAIGRNMAEAALDSAQCTKLCTFFKANRLSIGLMAMADVELALFFLEAAPLDWRYQISFFCAL